MFEFFLYILYKRINNILWFIKEKKRIRSSFSQTEFKLSITISILIIVHNETIIVCKVIVNIGIFRLSLWPYFFVLKLLRSYSIGIIIAIIKIYLHLKISNFHRHAGAVFCSKIPSCVRRTGPISIIISISENRTLPLQLRFFNILIPDILIYL